MMNQLKKIYLLATVLIAGLTHLSAQPQLQKLPVDPKIRFGKLDNGLTYYIRHNELPKERAEFFIAQNVGSVLEEDNQSGLAHFLEHMAFNGTKNYPGKSMINYLETIGVKFGANLNAYTGFDETVYNISNVPLTRDGIIDSCLLILHDWSSFISLEHEEIDKERGVIREEMRSYAEAYMRMVEKLLPQLMPGSRYAKRLPIGTEEVVMNFKYDELKDYYHKWYRPDLQAIIVVGDIDPDLIENKIKTMFTDIPKPVNPAPRVTYSVDDNDEPLIGIATDKEATHTQISVYYKNDPLPDEQKGTAIDLMMSYFNQAVSEMINTRFQEILNKANPPFVYAGGYYGDFYVARNKDAWNSNSVCKEKGEEESLKALVRETERAKRFGFMPGEYERAKVNILKGYENAYNEREKVQNNRYAREYVRNFTQMEPIPGIEMEYNMVQSFASNIPLEKINEYFANLIGDKNVVISLSAPEKEGLTTPSKEQLLSWYQEAKNETIEPYEEKVIDEPLLSELPKGGEIVEKTEGKLFETTELVLSNGVKVIIKPTTHKEDEILMAATSLGGTSLFPEDDLSNIKLYSPVANLGGLGTFSSTDLNKVLAGKKVSVFPTISLIREGFSGSSSIKDFETMLQLIYLNFTAPRMDQDAFESFLSRQKAMLESQEASPMMSFVDTMSLAAYKNFARSSRMKPADLEKVNYETIMNWRKDRYKDASDFTFIFVGNINVETAQPLIAQYLGALPALNRKETFKKIETGYNTGVIKKHFDKEVENPKATVVDLYTGFLKPNLVNKIKFDALKQILDILYVEKVREDESGTYGVSVYSDIAFYPEGQTSLQMYFETEPEKRDFLNGIVHRELKNIAENGPRQEDLNKVKEHMLKKQQENVQENGYWRHVLLNKAENDFDTYTEYASIVNALTVSDIRDITKEFLSQGNEIEVIMNGVKTK